MILEWRPIESAPKDGTVLMLWIPEYKYGVAFGYWSETLKEWLDDEDGCAIKEPSHWMPLPAPPGEEQP